MKKHAIFGTDFSKAVSEIIRQSSMFKSFGIEKLTIVHVVNLRNIFTESDFTLEGLEAKLSIQQKALQEKGFEVDTEFVFGIPSIELERKRKELGAQLTIVGSHGRTGSTSTLGGTISDLLNGIREPVLLVPLKKIESEVQSMMAQNIYQYEQRLKELKTYEPDWKLKCNRLNDHVLIATDFSDFSEAAFQWVRNQPAHFNKLTLLHVQDEVKIEKHLKSKLEEFNQIDQERLDRLRKSFKNAHPETKVETKIVYGKPTKEILGFISNNDVTLTAIGSQGRGYFADIFLGSVSNNVARKSTSNVIIVPKKKLGS